MVTGRPALHLSPLDSSRNASLLVLAYSPSNGIITIFRLILSLWLHWRLYHINQNLSSIIFWNNLSLHTGLVLRLPVPHRIHYASTLILSVPSSNNYETDRSVNPCLVAPLALRHGLLLMALSFITVIDYLRWFKRQSNSVMFSLLFILRGRICIW